MCGIAGLAGPGAEAHADLVGRMLDAIVHRGPDEGRHVAYPGAVLGIRRLSIIDLAGGSQPISNETGDVHVVFNGEIYDYKRHRQALIDRGHTFATGADTEVLVHRFEEKGSKFLDGLNGMWGAALYEERPRRLWLARDRFGKKPLYYTVRDGILRFASELKALLVDPEQPRRIDLESLRHYLMFECVPTPRSIFAGVHKLPPGHVLRFQDGEVSLRRYWDVDFLPRDRTPTRGEAVELLQAHLDRAVRTRLVADVPVGVFLSGGIDSSTVAWHAARAHPRVKTYSVGFAEKSFDESAYARLVAEHIGSEHHEQRLSAKDALDLLPKVIDVLDEPFGDASILPTYLLASFTRREVKVALGGDGGDEVFLGYPTYVAHRIAGLYERLPAGVRELASAAVDRLPVSTENISLDFKLRRFVQGVEYSPAVRNSVWLGSFAPEAAAAVLSTQVRRDLPHGTDGTELLAQLLSGVRVKHPMERVQYLDMKIYMSDDILVKVDRASMACSLEVRAPLLDYELVDFVAKLPLDYKLDGLTGKALLKRATAGRLPDDIRLRPKKGFGIPVARWINDELSGPVSAALDPKRIAREGLFDAAEVSRYLSEHRSGHRDHRKALWTLFMFQSWMERYAPR